MVTVWLGLFCGLAWVSGYTLLQENVEDEYRGRTFASLTVLSRLGLFLSLTIFPILSSVYDSTIHPGNEGFVLSGTRVALWTAGLLVLAAGLNTRRLLQRFRLSRPQPLTLVPKLSGRRRPACSSPSRGWKAPGRERRSVCARPICAGSGLDVLVTREPGGPSSASASASYCSIRTRASWTLGRRRSCSLRAGHRPWPRSSGRPSRRGRQ